MSHMAVKKSKPGEPVIVDLEALKLAAANCGLAWEARATYRWWATDYGRSAGDYPVPEGFALAELGHNAVLVLSVPPERRAELRKVYGNDPYEVGVVPDPHNPGCYTLMCDFFNDGYGLSQFVGQPATVEGAPDQIAPLLLMHYRMCADLLSARAAGDQISFEQLPDGSYVSYTVADEGRLRAAL